MEGKERKEREATPLIQNSWKNPALLSLIEPLVRL